MKVTMGLVFLTREYVPVKIVRYSSDGEYPFVGDNGEFYDLEGFAKGDSSKDLLVPEYANNL
jgi:hypothetical protein